MGTPSYTDWAERLRRITAPILDASPIWSRPGDPRQAPPAAGEPEAEFVESFADEEGHRRAVDGPFLSHLAGLESPAGGPGEALEVRLFRTLWAPEADPLALIEAEGPLQPEDTGEGLEIWTEHDLAGLHALWWLGLVHQRADVRARALDAAAWHVDNIQPDNATNHPWAVHAFVELGLSRDDPPALMHAETLVHNSRVTSGHPDRFSACILLDAARALEAIAG